MDKLLVTKALDAELESQYINLNDTKMKVHSTRNLQIVKYFSWFSMFIKYFLICL